MSHFIHSLSQFGVILIIKLDNKTPTFMLYGKFRTHLVIDIIILSALYLIMNFVLDFQI